eukprot:2095368-Rhodomonas_salina.1
MICGAPRRPPPWNTAVLRTQVLRTQTNPAFLYTHVVGNTEHESKTCTRTRSFPSRSRCSAVESEAYMPLSGAPISGSGGTHWRTNAGPMPALFHEWRASSRDERLTAPASETDCPLGSICWRRGSSARRR